MLLISIITFCCLGFSFFFDYGKTIHGIKKGLTLFLNLLPTLIVMLALVSIVLYLIPNETLVRYLGKDAGITGWFISALLGSIALMPGFVACPLCSVLLKSGVSYATVAVFMTTLTLVGVVTLPLEVKYFGLKTSIIRNLLSFIAALFIGLIMSFIL
jgi:uncharacterized membrane protein YraQ (UPF0718 family)